MMDLEWQDNYSVGVAEIDSQHKALLEIVNKLSAMSAGKARKKDFFAILNSLIHYADVHFTTEERYLKEYGYPGLQDQEQDHTSFTVRIFEIARKMDNNDPEVYREIAEFVRQWYLSHILGSDQEYKEFLVSRGAK